MKKFYLLFISLLLSTMQLLFSQADNLDSTFGKDGKFLIPVGDFAEANGVAVQTDGKIVLAGYASNDTRKAIAIIRLNSNGTPDISFGIKGKVITKIGETAYATAVALQADGKIVITGGLMRDSQYSFVVVRYNKNGSLDKSFNGTGMAHTTFSANENHANAISLQPDGKIVVAGVYNVAPYDIDFAIARFNTDGTADNTFGKGGRLTTSITDGWDEAHGVAVLSSGKIIVSGVSFYSSSAFDLLRYKSNGDLDSGFGDNGIVITHIGPYLDYDFVDDGGVLYFN